MATPRVLILRAPGTNCDRETSFAFERAGGLCESVHIERLLAEPELVRQFQILCLPGGFSYGDDIAAGRILSNQLRHHLADRLAEFKAAERLILGICNGFQILIKSGLILADEPAGPPATLTWNDSGKFEDRWVRLATSGSTCVFLRGIESMYLPIAHAEGKFVTRDPALLDRLQAEGRLALRYVGAAAPGDVDAPLAYPENPNGAQRNTAGVCDETGRVFGLMPHPERHVDPTHHPRWTRGESREEGDGLRLFRNAVEFFG